jgi:two-component system, chemotaxis family, protein-glutamate methylesterase/glutaminase
MSRHPRDVILVGASAGGVDAITRLVASLPADLHAAVLIVLHMAPEFPRSSFAARLNSVGPLRVAEALDGELIQKNRVYLCVPDRHLLLDGGRIRLSRGPKENHARPCVDALFRSAAQACGPRAIGIVLTGQLDDGTAGLWAIKDRGGLALVQDPAEALYRSMPASALRQVAVDYTLKISEMGPALRALTREEVVVTDEPDKQRTSLLVENSIARGESALDNGVLKLGGATRYTCPECHGVMFAAGEGPIVRFRCHTGHAYTARTLAAYSLPEIETNLWTALAQMEEREMLMREMGEADGRFTSQAHLVQQLRLRLRSLLDDPALMAVEELDRKAG